MRLQVYLMDWPDILKKIHNQKGLALNLSAKPFLCFTINNQRNGPVID